MQFGRTFAWPARQPGYGWGSFEQRDRHPGIMYLSPRYARHQRQSTLIDEQMVLATELAAVGRIGAGMLSAEGGWHAGRVDTGAFPLNLIVLPQVVRHGFVDALPDMPVAMRAGAASNSCRCHSPVHGTDIPRASRP